MDILKTTILRVDLVDFIVCDRELQAMTIFRKCQVRGNGDETLLLVNGAGRAAFPKAQTAII